ncbi:biotin transporter BioY [uncultured Demequina sp.]|uniref:biotin transporter BioY n=1 Tax=uncultured Demequina sp. TaxID=693499 RepID=UPI0025E02535|nr:biotin transporter BioY [uncultured Demequina sp.]
MRRHITGGDIALIAVFAAFIAASTAIPEVTLAFGVPFSLQTLAVVLAGMVLGPWRGAAAVLLYIVVGLAGAPIFANLVAGPAVFADVTGGFVIGFLPAAWIVGAITVAFRRRGSLGYLQLVIAGLASIPVVYAFGIPWLAWRAQIGLADAAIAMGPFVIGDTLKVLLAAAIAAIIHRAYPQLLPVARPSRAPVEREPAATA